MKFMKPGLAACMTMLAGDSGYALVVDPCGSKLYVANGRPDSISGIDTASYKAVHTIPVGKLPWGVVIR